MKTYNFTKAEVIEAMETEPLLKTGDWFNILFPGRVNLQSLKTCPVCAVGSLIRYKGWLKLVNYEEADIIDDLMENTGTDTEDSLKHGHYIAALSNYFEDEFQFEDPNTDIARMKLVNFVEGTFPDKFSVEVEG